MDNNITEDIKLFYCDYKQGKQVVKKILDQHLISEKDEEGNNLDSIVLMKDGTFLPIYNDKQLKKLLSFKQKDTKVYQIYDFIDVKFGSIRC